jgi:hypothetical protein
VRFVATPQYKALSQRYSEERGKVIALQGLNML